MRRYPNVKKVHVGFCPTGTMGRFVSGHTHSSEPDQMCLNPDEWNLNRPTLTFIHEYAHLAEGPRMGHSEGWAHAYLFYAKRAGFDINSEEMLEDLADSLMPEMDGDTLQEREQQYIEIMDRLYR